MTLTRALGLRSGVLLHGLSAATSIAILLTVAPPRVDATDTPPSANRTHALAIFDEIKYPAGFHHFDYVNPLAPKGGDIRLAVIGSFDSLNPFILKGVSAAGSTLIYSRLCTKSLDEPLTEYGQLAETIACPPDRSWVTFGLRSQARWHDGTPITAADVVFTFYTLVRQGTPFYRSFYADVDTVVALDERTVRFTLQVGDPDAEGIPKPDQSAGGVAIAANRELPLILGQLRILPKHYWETRDFGKTTLEPPLGSGPYRIESVDPGHSITYCRVPGNWDEDLPVQRGMNNFDRIRYDYYRDQTVAIEALKAGEYDFRSGGTAREWATAYDHPAVDEGRLVRERVPHQLITGMSGFVFNTRRPQFADPRVRRALAYAFDFEWTNATLFHGLYTRTRSYFDNSELASSGLPQGRELEILEPYRGRVPPETFTEPYEPPSTDGSGSIRENLRLARRLLASAGWRIRDNLLTHPATGQVMSIEFLLSRPSYERVVGPLQQHLLRLGIQSRIRTVDASQYWNRLQQFDYDVVARSWTQYLSPGNEQRNYWTSRAAESPGSRNYAGIRDPVVDELVEQLITAADRETQVAVARALDRVLLWGHYVIPHWHARAYRLVYWDRFGHPDRVPPHGMHFLRTWWMDAARNARLNQAR